MNCNSEMMQIVSTSEFLHVMCEQSPKFIPTP